MGALEEDVFAGIDSERPGIKIVAVKIFVPGIASSVVCPDSSL